MFRRGSGLARYARELLRHLPAALQPGDRVLALVRQGGSLPQIDGPVEEVVAGDAREVASILTAAGADVYHLPCLSGKRGHYSLMGRFPRSVLTVPDLILYDYERHFGVEQARRRRRQRFRNSLRRAVRAASGVLVYSNYISAAVVERFGIDCGRVRAIPLAASPGLSPPPSRVQQQVREQLGLPNRYLLSVGTDFPHKNLPLLLDGFLRFRSRPGASGIALALVGESVWAETRRRLREQVAAAGAGGQVHIIDHVPDHQLAALLAGATAFVFASREEGFGLPPLEALAAGTPVVCGRAGPLPEILGDVPEWFPVDDADALAAALCAVVLVPGRAEKQLSAAPILLARYRWETTARDTWDFYRQVVEWPNAAARARLLLAADGVWQDVKRSVAGASHRRARRR